MKRDDDEEVERDDDASHQMIHCNGSNSALDSKTNETMTIANCDFVAAVVVVAVDVVVAVVVVIDYEQLQLRRCSIVATKFDCLD